MKIKFANGTITKVVDKQTISKSDKFMFAKFFFRIPKFANLMESALND